MADRRVRAAWALVEEGIVEPVGRELQQRLRRAVLDLARAERRRSFAPVLHAGDPGGRSAALPVDPRDPRSPADHALRVDVVSAMLRRASGRGTTPLVWLARSGPLGVVGDADLHWLAATRAAAGELGVHLPFVVVNRQAWRDPRTGVGRVWKRVRSR